MKVAPVEKGVPEARLRAAPIQHTEWSNAACTLPGQGSGVAAEGAFPASTDQKQP